MKTCALLLVMMAISAALGLAQEAGWIGINIREHKDRGVVVRSLDPNGPAAKAGLKEDDVIVQFNNEDVVGVLQLTRLVRETPVGRTVDIKVLRDGKEQTIHITTQRNPNVRGLVHVEVPDTSILKDGIIRSLPNIEIMTRGVAIQSGIRVEQLTDQLRDFFGVYNDGGVLVTSVTPGSAAEKAGVKAGDVIMSVDGEAVRTTQQFSREMRLAGNRITLKIIRDKKEQEGPFHLNGFASEVVVAYAGEFARS